MSDNLRAAVKAGLSWAVRDKAQRLKDGDRFETTFASCRACDWSIADVDGSRVRRAAVVHPAACRARRAK